MDSCSKKTANRLEKLDYFEDPSLPLQVYIRDPHPVFPLHSHGFNELVVIFRGTAMHVIDDQKFPVRAGDVFVITKNHEHQYIDMHGLALANILFDSDELGMDEWDSRSLPGFHALFSLEPNFRAQHKFKSRLQLSEPKLNRVNELIRDLTQETRLMTPGYRVMARGIFMQLTVLLSRAYSSTQTEESIDLLRIGDAIAHLETNFSKKITLDDLAGIAHLSPRQFSRIFQKCIGRPPIEYLLNIRCQKAAELLKGTDRSITNIAFYCGFSDSNYFTRCFHKYLKQTPTQFRNG